MHRGHSQEGSGNCYRGAPSREGPRAGGQASLSSPGTKAARLVASVRCRRKKQETLVAQHFARVLALDQPRSLHKPAARDTKKLLFDPPLSSLPPLIGPADLDVGHSFFDLKRDFFPPPGDVGIDAASLPEILRQGAISQRITMVGVFKTGLHPGIEARHILGRKENRAAVAAATGRPGGGGAGGPGSHAASGAAGGHNTQARTGRARQEEAPVETTLAPVVLFETTVPARALAHEGHLQKLVQTLVDHDSHPRVRALKVLWSVQGLEGFHHMESPTDDAGRGVYRTCLLVGGPA